MKGHDGRPLNNGDEGMIHEFDTTDHLPAARGGLQER